MDAPWHVEGSHSVSPTNFDPTITSGFRFPRDLTVYDSTLRKLLVTTGTRPSVSGVLRVAEELGRAGIRHVVMNLAWSGDRSPDAHELDVVRALHAHDFGFTVHVSSENLTPFGSRHYSSPSHTLDVLADMGAQHVGINLRCHADAGLLRQQDEWLEEVADWTRRADVKLFAGIADPARAPVDVVVQLAQRCEALGAGHLDLHDASSALTPEGASLFVSNLLSKLNGDLRVTVHIHDDFGLATAATIAATAAGAHPDVAVNGVSYRAGFASLEQVALCLEVLYGVRTGIDLSRLTRLSRLVEEVTGLPARVLQPITGRHAFVRDLPSQALAVLQGGPDAWPPSASCFAPSLVGQTMEVVWGVHVSDRMLEAKLAQLGITPTEALVDAIRAEIGRRLDRLTSYPYWLTEEEVSQVCRDVSTTALVSPE